MIKNILLLGLFMTLHQCLNSTVEIKQFQQSQKDELRLALGAMWQEFSGWKMTPEEIAEKYCDDEHKIQSLYFDNGGTYLMLLDNGKIVGTGALKRINAETAELKRMYLFPKYFGSGWSSKIFDQLIVFAKAHGYKKIRLGVFDPVLQVRAVAFYSKRGFYKIAAYDDQNLGLYMEKQL